ncbi:N-acetylmuramoyl-L-alanine amidase [Halobacillus karajensis]|uniref:Sporulation-specific N-acetylmuramoyl-L-alanine amidase n=1 Tax=Halobacillus karajensis TaxID=195088 RepID=A0A024P4A9_9BACI|nr:N-acetylmuramoyl-L-alanine amidase [Halobacillus karajensis]CDQ20845.1 Sporulation-specific N-acetylmuramoyl-L-alanine amidase [Halobacillus karajensis]CDQ23685.1 Sporulation-specific N-acetylmuramoyl-L-alanine amidase [Halobacillus karajensis]CDQ27163.1 Sporulation-specific N-acetylmuramoyl-L-alanine amidase [Halobacillus karajensis]SEI03765.1 N-acetylmuramoyl-L-alanine amidase [Halobacillus karajensis]
MAKLLKPNGSWNGKTVALDDGHGMGTPGKRTSYIPELGRSIRENEFNRKVVAFLTEMLLAHGFRVLLVAPTDADTSLNDRTNAANRHNVDIYVSIHFNAMSFEFDFSTADGISTHVYLGNMKYKSGDLARCLAKYLRQGTKQDWRGFKENNFHVLRETNMPAVLTENGFMDDPREAMLMIKESYQIETAAEHAQGICDYFNIAWKGANVTEKNWLERGDTGAKVLEAQRELKELGHYKGELDGSYGPATEDAVKSFQKEQEIKEDGIFGPNTQKHINAAMDKYTAAQEDEKQMEKNLKETGFKDVEKGSTLQQEITKAKQLGITKGVGNDLFNPNQNVTRAESVAFAVRAYEKAFKDAKQSFDK